MQLLTQLLFAIFVFGIFHRIPADFRKVKVGDKEVIFNFMHLSFFDQPFYITTLLKLDSHSFKLALSYIFINRKCVVLFLQQRIISHSRRIKAIIRIKINNPTLQGAVKHLYWVGDDRSSSTCIFTNHSIKHRFTTILSPNPVFIYKKAVLSLPPSFQEAYQVQPQGKHSKSLRKNVHSSRRTTFMKKVTNQQTRTIVRLCGPPVEILTPSHYLFSQLGVTLCVNERKCWPVCRQCAIQRKLSSKNYFFAPGSGLLLLLCDFLMRIHRG